MKKDVQQNILYNIFCFPLKRLTYTDSNKKTDNKFGIEFYFIPLFVKICYVQTGKKPLPNHFIGAASSNKPPTLNTTKQ